ncbi:MAG: stringent starvation protein B [Gammaproteobacteria bacterium]|jgi:stringent starvation protein B
MLTSRTPYLLRAIYEWIADNDLTPYVLVDAGADGVEVPAHVIQDGKVVLNISMNAVRNLELGNQYVSFSARFAGKAEQILVPIDAIEVVYAKENGVGMALSANTDLPPEPEGPSHDDDSPAPSPPSKPRPSLRVVK